MLQCVLLYLVCVPSCFTHKKLCRRGPPEKLGPRHLRLGIAGSPCVAASQKKSKELDTTHVGHSWCFFFSFWRTGLCGALNWEWRVLLSLCSSQCVLSLHPNLYVFKSWLTLTCVLLDQVEADDSNETRHATPRECHRLSSWKARWVDRHVILSMIDTGIYVEEN